MIKYLYLGNEGIKTLKPNYPSNFVEKLHNYDWSIRACLVDQ